MLTHIQIKDFAIIEQLELELKSGMTIVTGETGAGKSIIIDALDIALGDRAESNLIRYGAERSEITVTFDVLKIPAAQIWLKTQELDEGHDCIIRRTFSNTGRSRNFINGRPVTLQQLRDIGGLLIHIHAQHSQQSLLKRDEQRQMLDDYAGSSSLCIEVATAYEKWAILQAQITTLQTPLQDKESRVTLLRYQAQELDELAIKANEVETLHQEQRQLTSVEERRSACQTALDLLSENDQYAALTALYNIERALTPLLACDTQLSPLLELINNANIQLQEANSELQNYLERMNVDPERLQWVEQRLDRIHTLARKHHTQSEQLAQCHEKILQELDQLEHSDEHLRELEAALKIAQTQYDILAEKLTKSRQQAASRLEKVISAEIQKLGMPHGHFAVAFADVESDYRSRSGRDKLEFLVSANKGQPAQPLNKVASGGELSRISLAIHVITAQLNVTPTLIFDEVDVGIGGGTAEIVGQLLRRLGDTTQVLCVTHLPQVAAQGHHHLHINKSAEKDKTATRVNFLTQEQRVQELARMLGGVKITDKTVAHAREMLEVTI